MDDRDICERLEDPSYDGAIYIRQDAAKEIRALRAKIAEQEEWNSLRAMDIVTLGLEVGRLWEALASSESWISRWAKHVGNCSGSDETCTCGRAAILFEARAALAEKGDK